MLKPVPLLLLLMVVLLASVGVSMDDAEDASTPTNRAINSFLFPCVDNNCHAANCALDWLGFSVLMSFAVRDGSIGSAGCARLVFGVVVVAQSVVFVFIFLFLLLLLFVIAMASIVCCDAQIKLFDTTITVCCVRASTTSGTVPFLVAPMVNSLDPTTTRK